MPLARLTIAFTIAVFAFWTGAEAGERNMDQRAIRLQDKTAEFYQEVNARFPEAAHFEQLRSDTAELVSLASEIHVLAHNGYPAGHVAESLARMDRLIRQTKDFVDHIAHDAYRGEGRVYGNVGRVKYMLNSMKNTVSNMRSDVDEYAERIGESRHRTLLRVPYDRGIDRGHCLLDGRGVYDDDRWPGRFGEPDGHAAGPNHPEGHEDLLRRGARRGREF